MSKRAVKTCLFILAISLGLAGNAGADYTWYSYGGHEYAKTQNIVHWAQSEAEANGLGGYLVAINYLGEQNWLINTFGSFYSWIGFYRVGENWFWTSGEPVTFTNWGGGYPSGEPDFNYAVMYSPFGGTWVNYSNDFSFYGIIERASITPLPSTLLLLGSALAGLAVWRRRRG